MLTKSYKTDSIYFINNYIVRKKKMEDEGSGFVDRALKNTAAVWHIPILTPKIQCGT